MYAEERHKSVVKRWANATSRAWYVDVYPNARRKVTRHVAEGGIRTQLTARRVVKPTRGATYGGTIDKPFVGSFVHRFVRSCRQN